MRARLACLLIGSALGTVATPAQAHLMPKQQGTLNVRDSAAFGAFSIPVSALTGWDDNHDGRMSDREFGIHRGLIERALDAGIDISNGRERGQRVLVLPSVELDESDPDAVRGGTHLLVLVRQSFSAVPRELRLRLTLFGTAADEKKFIIKATSHGSTEVAILEAPRGAHAFFAPIHQLVTRYVTPLLHAVRSGSTLIITAIVLLAGAVLVRRSRAGAQLPAR